MTFNDKLYSKTRWLSSTTYAMCKTGIQASVSLFGKNPQWTLTTKVFKLVESSHRGFLQDKLKVTQNENITNGHAIILCFSGLLTPQHTLKHLSHSPINTHIHRLVTEISPFAQTLYVQVMQFGVHYLSQGYFDTLTVRVVHWSEDELTAALPPEP